MAQKIGLNFVGSFKERNVQKVPVLEDQPTGDVQALGDVASLVSI